MTEAKATDAKAARAAPVFQVSPLELRLYLVAVLAGIYATVWLLVWRGAEAAPVVAATPDPVTPPASGAPRPAPSRGAGVWFEDVPEPQRPPLALPPGWRLASRRELQELAAAPGVASQAPAPRVVRAPARRLRLRTRSS